MLESSVNFPRLLSFVSKCSPSKTWIIRSGGEAGNMSISEFDGTEEITYI
jgi:hypothetical protein